MKNTIVAQFFQEYLNGVWKGSMNRLLMFLFGTTICVVSVLSMIAIIKGKITTGDLGGVCGLLGTLISPILILGGFSLSAKNTDLKSTTPNPNLPPQTPQA